MIITMKTMYYYVKLVRINTNILITRKDIRKYSEKSVVENNIIKTTNWQSIDWKRTYSEIETLQEKIVNATLKKNYEKVYLLQRQIVLSFAGRALAVRKVVTNSGSKTAGIDEVKWNGPKDYWKAINDLKVIVLNPKEYKAKPVLRIHIPKGNTGETRPLGIPTLIDRTVQAVYHLAIDPVVETISDKNSYGFRKYRSTHDAIISIRSLMDKRIHPHWILEVDLLKCFDKINHEFLMKHTPICDKSVLLQWLKSGVIEDYKFLITTEGVPQGGIISPVLCNVALNGIENEVKKAW
jgi:RNA-directed DNA polymerase